MGFFEGRRQRARESLEEEMNKLEGASERLEEAKKRYEDLPRRKEQARIDLEELVATSKALLSERDPEARAKLEQKKADLQKQLGDFGYRF